MGSNRRRFLVGAAATGIAGALGIYGSKTWWAVDRDPKVPFLGLHQAGITTPAPAAALFVAFDTTASNRDDLNRLLQTLTQRIRFLMAGGTPVERDPKFPPSDSGILGSTFPADNLTVTVAVGSSLFDQRFGLQTQRPQHLTPMPAFQNDRLDPNLCHGDLMLQFCANHAETNVHALRDILKQCAGTLVMRWSITGFQQPNTLKNPHRTSVRNLLGFKDGTANPDPQDAQWMDRLVWVQANQGEPTWATGGSYQVVRVIRMLVEEWDRATLEEQEQIMGRKKASGAPLDGQREEDIPRFAKDPRGLQIPLDAHIRRANPRTPDTEANRILRRGFHFAQGFDQAGHLDQGLLFACFQQDLDRGFVAIQNRLKGESLEEYIQPIGGGYFFVLPGVKSPDQYFGQQLLSI